MSSKKRAVTVAGVIGQFSQVLGNLAISAREDLEELMGGGPTAEAFARFKVARHLRAEADRQERLAEPLVGVKAKRGKE